MKVVTEQEERYVHLFQCVEDLNGAWRVLHELKDSGAAGELAQAAFRYALVEYAKPYKRSEGTVTKWHQLNEDSVPPQYVDLHRDLVSARDKIHAHSDLTVREARLRVRQTKDGKIVTPVRKGVDVAEEYSRLDSIIDLVEVTIEGLYHELKDLGQSLPEN